MSAGNVHLASVFPRETFRLHCRLHADWIFSFSPVAAGNASTVHSSSAAAQELVSFPRDIAAKKEKEQQDRISHIWLPVNEWCIHKLCPTDETRFLKSSRSDTSV